MVDSFLTLDSLTPQEQERRDARTQTNFGHRYSTHQQVVFYKPSWFMREQPYENKTSKLLTGQEMKRLFSNPDLIHKRFR